MSRIIVALAMMSSASALQFFTNNTETQRFMFDEFKSSYGRTYSAEEDESRFAIFVENLAIIDERNAAEGEMIHGITQFSDLSQEEFKARYLLSLPRSEPAPVTYTGDALAPGATVNVNWAGIYTTPVKNQGYCGSCWAFSATEQIESNYWMASGQELILSPQQITSCDKTSFGCNGGTTESAYNYVSKTGGLELNSAYPYTSGSKGVTGSCTSSSSKFVVTISGYTTVSSSASGEATMASYVSKTGPLSICVDAQTWSSYTHGVMTTCPNSVDHCVQAVGLNTAASTPYWIVRNSWGTTWGQAGYIYLKYGVNLCQLASDATYATGAKAV